MSLFQRTIIKKQIAAANEKIAKAYKLFASYFLNPEIQENIRGSKEEQFQEGFLRELFVKVLGYTLNPQPNYNLITEKKNETDSKKADGAIIVNGEVRAVIELKDHKTTDLKQVETQAFGYKNNNRKTLYVIISNFEKLRFYIDNTIDFIEFNLFTISEDDFAVLWICLAYENIVKDLPKQLKSESVSNEDQITKTLYKDYSDFKQKLFADMVKNNPQFDQLTLFKKSQKLLDRLLFIFFAEDCNLLPANSISQIVEQWETLKKLDEYRPLYDRFKKYFGYLNIGHKGNKYEIFAYNGGLFKSDEIIDNVIVSDEILQLHTLRISQYDFASDVDVNILGHIFENSLTEIEEITADLTKELIPLPDRKTTSKRKKDGVFYTPRYITTYIVENTLGKLCSNKKADIEIIETEYFADKKRQSITKKKLDDKLTQYRKWLLSLTICDPACGSGAFLNAALDFLMNEHRLIDEMTSKILGHSIVFPDIENAILENNLYGVDINEESVEIARLALWLRTAKPHRKLTSLNNNIKCGNSLIQGDESLCPANQQGVSTPCFNWHKEFPQVFKEKDKKAFHITTAIHDSRTSQRMIDYKVRERRYNKGINPLVSSPRPLDAEDEIIITKTIAEIV
ncbi:MAG: N-6 DNA methylase, partial [Prevotellaceae bacterium]|nr:N-6 DNA methylase [Prevotellaceae bacterium]